ncbi:MAG: trypsin-like peptidase domain-containing protein [Candidatus Sungbacteria bacterium]|uniref:Trypsin-like peptidase domain-containing protein n=1 Tax=Candidatus Sungiibacteriota bacterium TaxID=2750080 RepID=A0A931SBA0_9BACT|nr:trypsin-like peptidase domain-containing protein [Candidatus Sungbacteria bacterium]
MPLSADEIYQKLYLAVVQVICERENNAVVTGSGVIVSPEGVVLTNAHVVEQAKQCFVKTGNPAVSLGKLRIVFAGNTTEKIAATLVPKEDFALGKISDVVSSSAAKPPFKYLDLDAEYVMRIGDGFYAAAYPTELIGSGGFLAGKQNLVYTTTKVIDAFRVDDASVTYDVIELEGSIATQQGSSGSPIISPRDGSVIGIVFGQTGLEIDNGFEPPTIVETARRTELAFLVSHLDRTIKKEKGKSLSEFIRELSLE